LTGAATADLFRMPWMASDNAMTWLEPTRKCNITCDACFAANDPRSEKSLAWIEHEIDVLLRLRRCDAMLIAGGEPLTHPDIVDVVALVKRRGVKPVLVTNGVSLTPALLADLRRAGAFGFTFHVDSHQRRPGWLGQSERELNALRSEFADSVHAEGGLSCSFNTTIFPDTLAAVPDVVAWALERPDRVHVLTLICVRMAEPDGPFAYWAGDREVDLRETPYASAKSYGNLTSEEILEQVRKVIPDFALCAYLGGTQRPQALKWAIGCHLTRGGKSFGCVGPRFMEIMQNGSHALRGRYLAYSHPRESRMGRASLLLGLVDSGLRHAAARWLSSLVRHPGDAFKRLHLQSLTVVQPVDVLPSGEMDTCDGCPNATFWQERLVAACRLDEYQRYGRALHAVPRAGRG
jgi:MoaA/NifB/PqqE/SkfB family radical SAM enzyme